MPTCPRCGYDLSGHAATWETVCPLEGQCSECGLEFAWWEVLVDRERFNRRHVEHCERRAIPIAAVRTLLWCVLPWVFWKKVQLRHEPRVGRMVLWLGLMLVGSHLSAAAVVTLALWRLDVDRVQARNSTIQRYDLGYRQRVAELEVRNGTGELSSRELEYLEHARDWLAAPPRPVAVPMPELHHVTKALGYPFAYIEDYGARAVQTRGIRFAPTRLNPYSPDWEFKLIRFWRQPLFVVGMIFSVGYLFMLILLPATSRRLKIRSGHLARAGIFGMFWLVLPPLQRALAGTAYVIEDLTDGRSNIDRWLAWADADAWPLWCWFAAAWISLWWLCTIWRGLRFPNPIFHWLMLTIPVAILAIAVLAFVLGPLEINAMIDVDNLMSVDDGYEFDPENLAGGYVDRVR